MSTPTETVLAFLAMCEKPGGIGDAVRAFFTDRTHYVNVGMTDTVGIEAGMAVLQGFEAMTGANALKVDMLAISEDGNKVLTERIDYLMKPDGTAAMTIPLMGIFEVENGKITAWRDYFDTAGIAQGAAAQ